MCGGPGRAVIANLTPGHVDVHLLTPFEYVRGAECINAISRMTSIRFHGGMTVNWLERRLRGRIGNCDSKQRCCRKRYVIVNMAAAPLAEYKGRCIRGLESCRVCPVMLWRTSFVVGMPWIQVGVFRCW